jgi:hypothetical protein
MQGKSGIYFCLHFNQTPERANNPPHFCVPGPRFINRVIHRFSGLIRKLPTAMSGRTAASNPCDPSGVPGRDRLPEWQTPRGRRTRRRRKPDSDSWSPSRVTKAIPGRVVGRLITRLLAGGREIRTAGPSRKGQCRDVKRGPARRVREGSEKHPVLRGDRRFESLFLHRRVLSRR